MPHITFYHFQVFPKLHLLSSVNLYYFQFVLKNVSITKYLNHFQVFPKFHLLSSVNLLRFAISRLLENGSTVQISTIKSTPRREVDKRASQTSSAKTTIAKTPKTTSSKTSSTTSNSSNETPLKRPTDTSNQTPSTDKRFSRSVPMNLNNWDLEMEDPLEQVTVQHSEKKSSIRRRLVSSALEHTTPRSPVTPDVAIMEEIDELSNTLDDIIETMEDVEKPIKKRTKATPAEKLRSEIQDLCTTLDYLLDSSEEEELDRDLKTFESITLKKDVITPVTSPVTPVKTSAFSRVPSSKRRQLPSTASLSKTPNKASPLATNPRTPEKRTSIRNRTPTKSDSRQNQHSEIDQSPLRESQNKKVKKTPCYAIPHLTIPYHSMPAIPYHTITIP